MGAWTLARWSGIVRTARLNGPDERVHLQYLLERGIPLIRGHGDWRWYEVPKEGGWKGLDLDGLPVPKDTSYLEALMPWSEEYKAYAAAWRERRRETLRTYGRPISAQAGKAKRNEGDDGLADGHREKADDAA